jgi:hypothetical protein
MQLVLWLRRAVSTACFFKKTFHWKFFTPGQKITTGHEERAVENHEIFDHLFINKN